MNRAGHNERKRQILELLSQRQATAEDIARETGINGRTARNHLLRYHRYRLIDRTGGELIPGWGKSPFVYGLNERGEEKLKILKVHPRNISPSTHI